MNPAKAVKVRKRLNTYNMVANLTWSVVCLLPVSVFCYSFLSGKLFCIFLLLSMLSVLLPKRFLNQLSVKRTKRFYQKAGVVFINRFTQNGAIINRLVRKKYPAYKMIFKTDYSINKLLQQTYMQEKFHCLLLLFFIFCSVCAFMENKAVWAFVIIITNIIYNFYPILLQHYIRMRLINLDKKNAYAKKTVAHSKAKPSSKPVVF